MNEQPISLYLDLEDDASADLEIVSRAALSFAKALREIAQYVDPATTVRIELESGTRGSFSLNSVVRPIKSAVKNPKYRNAVVLAALFWFSNKALDWTAGKALDELWESLVGSQDGVEVTQSLSEDDLAEIRAIFEDIVNTRVGQTEASNVFRELGEDDAVRGAGVTPRSGARPEDVVSRAHFRTLSDETSEDTAPTERTDTERLTVVLVRPVLKLDSKRMWRFNSHLGEFSARVTDLERLDRILSGRDRVPMTEGLWMEIELETEMKFDGRIWVPVERRVSKIYSVHPPSSQEGLGISPSR